VSFILSSPCNSAVVNHSHQSTVPDTGQRLQSPVISHSHRSFVTVSVVSQSPVISCSHCSSATVIVHQLQSLFVSYSHCSSATFTVHQLQSLFMSYSHCSSATVTGIIASSRPSSNGLSSYFSMGQPSSHLPSSNHSRATASAIQWYGRCLLTRFCSW
jgi:hypothetical protein